MAAGLSLLNNKHIVIVDWGTSYLRAYLCKVTDLGLSRCDTAIGLGVLKVNGNFEGELFSRIQPWVEKFGNMAIMMSGQIGSSLGWHETQYLPCPTQPSSIASSCYKFVKQDHCMAIIPGLSCSHGNDYHDVMRGEELQVLGWLEQNPAHQIGTHLVCLPGTHTKWVMIKDGEIQLFKTAMTGELFELLCNHSVLIQPGKKEYNFEAFEQGATYTLNSELGSFTHGLFSVRTKQLFRELPPKHAASYLSGMLIGSDVRAALNATEWRLSELDNVAIIGSNHLSEQFSHVLTLLNVNNQLYDVEECSIAGFSKLYKLIEIHND